MGQACLEAAPVSWLRIKMADNRVGISVVVPCVVAYNLDQHPGIPFMPHMATHLAGALDGFSCQVRVI